MVAGEGEHDVVARLMRAELSVLGAAIATAAGEYGDREAFRQGQEQARRAVVMLEGKFAAIRASKAPSL
jgi:hypothetical protein